MKFAITSIDKKEIPSVKPSGKKFRMTLVKFRKIIQGISLSVFILLFLFTVYPYPLQFPVDAFLRLDPLVALVGMIASRTVIVTMLWSAGLIALTLLIGRFFCGYICPLGSLIDIWDYLFLQKRRETLDPKPNRNIKYFVLIGVIASSLVGADVLCYLSPMAIVPRFFTTVVFPPAIAFVNLILDIFRPVTEFLGMDKLAQTSFKSSFFTGSAAVLLFTGAIFAANFFGKRFWCRYICPTGAFLSLFSRFGLVKRIVSRETCTGCKRCAMFCDMHAIDKDLTGTILSECTLCGNCIEACPRKSEKLGLTPPGFSGNDGLLMVDRRKFIYATAAGIAGASAITAGIHTDRNMNGRLIRPPGAKPENEFLARCIRCGECMKVCKTNGLQPAIFDAGFNGVWSPRLVPRRGACEDKCAMCGQVCPTQAIRKLPLEEKLFAKIGTAVIDRSRCIAWEQKKLCLICEEICPYNAVQYKIVDNYDGPFKRPFVQADKCMGCGWCENKCPVGGRGAIEVYSIGEERQRSGSYITGQKKALREKRSDHELSYDSDAIGSGGESHTPVGKNKPVGTPAPDSLKTDSEPLPGGFTE
jgi:polyferredoxin